MFSDRGTRIVKEFLDHIGVVLGIVSNEGPFTDSTVDRWTVELKSLQIDKPESRRYDAYRLGATANRFLSQS